MGKGFKERDNGSEGRDVGGRGAGSKWGEVVVAPVGYNQDVFKAMYRADGKTTCEVSGTEDHSSLWIVSERLQEKDSGSTGAGGREGGSDVGACTPGGRVRVRFRQVKGGVRRVEATP